MASPTSSLASPTSNSKTDIPVAQCIARKIPVAIWMIKHIAAELPKVESRVHLSNRKLRRTAWWQGARVGFANNAAPHHERRSRSWGSSATPSEGGDRNLAPRVLVERSSEMSRAATCALYSAAKKCAHLLASALLCSRNSAVTATRRPTYTAAEPKAP